MLFVLNVRRLCANGGMRSIASDYTLEKNVNLAIRLSS